MGIVPGERGAGVDGRALRLGGDGIDGRRQQRRVGEAGAHGVDGDAGRGKFCGERTRKAEHAVLGGDVGRDIGVAFERGGRGDEHQPAATLARAGAGEVGEARARGIERTGEIDVDHALPVRAVDPTEGRALGRAGIGDDDIDGAVLLARAGDHRRAVGFTRDVGDDARASKRARHGLELRFVAAGNGDGGAGLTKRARDRGADA